MTNERYAELRKLAEEAPVTWEALADGLTLEERFDLASALEREVLHLARAARYIGYRCGYMQGDQGHARSIQAQNTAARQVGRAFGRNRVEDIRV